MPMGFPNYHHRFQLSLLISVLIIYFLPTTYPLSFNFFPLGTSVINNLKTLGNVSIQPDAVELTYWSNNDPRYSAGHLYYKDQLFLWDSSTKEAASFNCSFQFKILPQDITYCAYPGDGLAFILLDPSFSADALNHAKGRGLGLVDDSGSASADVVAVEFDTFQNSFDPDDNHIGIDVNSYISRANTSNLNFRMASSSSVFSWVDYSSSQSLLEVYASNHSSIKPSSSLLSYTINLTKLLPEYVYIGFSAATGACAEYHQILSWSFNSTTIGVTDTAPQPAPAPAPVPAKVPQSQPIVDTPIINKDGPNISHFVGLGMGIFVGFVILVLLALFLRRRLQMCRRKRQRFDPQMPLRIDLTGLPSPSEGGYGLRKFNYKDLSDATNNFSEEYLLGQGGFGPVYKGVLSADRSEVAVKCISQRSSQGEKEFFAEVSIISRTRHKNLVQLKGWCRDKCNLLLVYEFLPNGSLDTHLFGQSSSLILDWSTRYNIVCGLGSALQYLHQQCEKVIVHRDIKASNVMLDTNYNAKLGDFGLARQLGEGVEGHMTIAAGTVGYMAPESCGTGCATPESDVYSYGIVLLEVACGRRPVDRFESRLLDWVWDLHSKGRLKEACDTRLRGAFDEEQLVRTLIVGLACSHPDPKLRPSVNLALMALQGQVPLPTIPTLQPVAYYGPPLSVSLLSSTTTTSSSCLPISSSSSAPDSDKSAEKALLRWAA